MATIKIRQIKSRIGMSKVECRTLDSLGLKKMKLWSIMTTLL